MNLVDAKFGDRIKISGGIRYEYEMKDESDPKYITEIIRLEEPTTTTTTTTEPPSTPPRPTRSARMNTATGLRPMYFLSNLMCIILVLQYPLQFI